MDRTDITELNALKTVFSLTEVQQFYYVGGDDRCISCPTCWSKPRPPLSTDETP